MLAVLWGVAPTTRAFATKASSPSNPSLPSAPRSQCSRQHDEDHGNDTEAEPQAEGDGKIGETEGSQDPRQAEEAQEGAGAVFTRDRHRDLHANRAVQASQNDVQRPGMPHVSVVID
jgi:hypothetical protein